MTHGLLADTIYAPAAGAGRSALGVIRISGPAAGKVVTVLGGALPEPRVATLRRLRDPRDLAEVDQAVLLWFPAPRSATGEDVLEIQHHGGPAVLAWLLEILTLVPGCRPAEPGEFARRAFLAGKLDLTAAEGLADLVDAQTRAQARQALRQLDGELGRLYGSWRARLLDALARIEAEIDFGSEGEEVPPAHLAPELADIAAEMALHLGDGRGERLRSGIQIAVTGAPNVGKSSLVNLLARREVALVSEHPGTTRDVIEASLEIAGVPVTLLDTAGLRETDDPVEAMGVERARARTTRADLELRLFPAGTEPPPATATTILVASKRDRAPAAPLPEAAVAISAVAAPGVSALLDRLAARVAPLAGFADEPLITRTRHRAAVAEASAALALVPPPA